MSDVEAGAYGVGHSNELMDANELSMNKLWSAFSARYVLRD